MKNENVLFTLLKAVKTLIQLVISTLREKCFA